VFVVVVSIVTHCLDHIDGEAVNTSNHLWIHHHHHFIIIIIIIQGQQDRSCCCCCVFIVCSILLLKSNLFVNSVCVIYIKERQWLCRAKYGLLSSFSSSSSSRAFTQCFCSTSLLTCHIFLIFCCLVPNLK